MANKIVDYNGTEVTIYFDYNTKTPTGLEFFGVTYIDEESGYVEWATPDEDVFQWAEAYIETGPEPKAAENAEVSPALQEALLGADG